MKMKHLIDFNFYQNYRQRYTVIPIITVRGPFTDLKLRYEATESTHFSFKAI